MWTWESAEVSALPKHCELLNPPHYERTIPVSGFVATV